MKELKMLAAGAGVIWLAGKALVLAEAGMTRLLMATGLDWGRAAAQAPVMLWAVVCSLGALAIWMLFNIEEERRRKAHRASGRSALTCRAEGGVNCDAKKS